MQRHLTDGQLIEATVGGGTAAQAAYCARHVERCDECRARHEAMHALLHDAADAAAVDADEAFPRERLARQHAHIMERVEQMSRVGRVISFPTAPGRVAPPAAASGTRWVAAAAAAGLIVGLLGGHLTRELRVLPGTLAGSPPATAAQAVIRPVSQPSDDDLLGQVEVAFEGRGPSALRPLDALTPVAWDVRE